MGCYARCKSCNTNLYLQEQKDQLRFPTQITCFTCSLSNTYYVYEVTQEIHDYKCPFCKKNFFTRRPPPLSVLCPHSKSSLYINSDGSIMLLQNGALPTKESDAVGGALIGGLIGALLGPEGALLGALLGGGLAYQGQKKEAIYQDGI